MTGGGDGYVCGKVLRKKPLHFAHNHTAIFEVYILNNILYNGHSSNQHVHTVHILIVRQVSKVGH